MLHGSILSSINLTVKRVGTFSLRSGKQLTSVGSRFLASSALPESVTRVGNAEVFPNEYPGQNYEFNWALNFDGVTPLKKSAFRITKPLDAKVAGLTPLSKTPLKVDTAAAKSRFPEAGSDQLSFETFDQASQRLKDLLSTSDHLYCPEGHMPLIPRSSGSTLPTSRIGVRIITNSATVAPSLLAYLERAPKRSPTAQPITAYVLEGSEDSFCGYAIEEIVDNESGEVKSVAAVVVMGKKPSIETVVAGLELSAAGLLEDEMARAKKAQEESKK